MGLLLYLKQSYTCSRKGTSPQHPCTGDWVRETHRAPTPPRPHAMLPAEPIVLLLDGFEHEWWGVHGLLNGWQLTVLLEVDAALGAEQDVLPAPVVPIFGCCGGKGLRVPILHTTSPLVQPEPHNRGRLLKQSMFQGILCAWLLGHPGGGGYKLPGASAPIMHPLDQSSLPTIQYRTPY